MAAPIRLFEKTPAGLLVEVDPAEADAARAGRRISAMHLPIEVLWTAEEEAARDAEETAAVADAKARQDAAAKAEADRQAAIETAHAELDKAGLGALKALIK